MTSNPLPPSPLPAPAANLMSAEELRWNLAQRGITFEIRNGRLWIRPGTAYKTLTDEERAVIRHRREELKQLVRDGVPVSAPPARESKVNQEKLETSAAPKPKPEPPPIPDHIRRIVDWNKPAERARREAEATAVMLRDR